MNVNILKNILTIGEVPRS